MKLSKKLAAACEALADPGGKPTRGRKPAAPKKLAAGWAVELTLPCVVRSEANQRCHWAVRRRRFDTQAAFLRVAFIDARLTMWLPRQSLTVTFTHVGRTMDTDNLAGAFKGLRDSLAKFLGVDDADPTVAWEYRQELPGGGTPGVRVRVSNRD